MTADDTPAVPDTEAVREALAWFREDPKRLACLDSATALAIDLQHAATIVRAALARDVPADPENGPWAALVRELEATAVQVENGDLSGLPTTEYQGDMAAGYRGAANRARVVLARDVPAPGDEPTTRADVTRLQAALASLDVPEREDEDEHEFHDGQRWMLGKVRNMLRRIHESGVSPGAGTWYRVENGWRRDSDAGGSMFVQDGTLPGWDETGPGEPLAVSDQAGTAPTDEPPYSRGWRVGDRVRVKATGERGEVEAALGDGVNVRIPQENAPSHVVHFTATDLVPDRAGDDEPRTEWRVTGWTSRGSRLTADRPSRSAADAEAEAMRDEGLRDVRVAPRVAAAPAVDTAAPDPLRAPVEALLAAWEDLTVVATTLDERVAEVRRHLERTS